MTRQLCNECGLALNEDHAQRTEKLSKGQAIAHASPIQEKLLAQACQQALQNSSVQYKPNWACGLFLFQRDFVFKTRQKYSNATFCNATLFQRDFVYSKATFF